jgi:hypothetical protein
MKLIINPIFVVPSAIPTMPLSLRRFGKTQQLDFAWVICCTHAAMYQNSPNQNLHAEPE